MLGVDEVFVGLKLQYYIGLIVLIGLIGANKAYRADTANSA